jgi:hypothetical protein
VVKGQWFETGCLQQNESYQKKKKSKILTVFSYLTLFPFCQHIQISSANPKREKSHCFLFANISKLAPQIPKEKNPTVSFLPIAKTSSLASRKISRVKRGRNRKRKRRAAGERQLFNFAKSLKFPNHQAASRRAHTRNSEMEHNTKALIAASRRVMAIARHVEASSPSAAELLDLHRTAATNQGGLLKGQVPARALAKRPC